MPMERQEERPGVNTSLVSFCRNSGSKAAIRAYSLHEYCPSLSTPLRLSFLWVYYPTSCLRGLGKEGERPISEGEFVRCETLLSVLVL